MKHIRMLMVIFGFALISACASTETMDTGEADTATEPAMSEEQPAAMKEEPPVPMEEEQPVAMEEPMPEAKAEAMAEEAAAPAEAESAEDDSGNLVSTCTLDGAQRVITVMYDNPETGTACEVSYEKASGTQVLWSANNDRDYCLGKAQAFVEKQKGWGWDCSELK